MKGECPHTLLAPHKVKWIDENHIAVNVIATASIFPVIFGMKNSLEVDFNTTCITLEKVTSECLL